uniref:F-box domain-containing protein n=1 Tax=Steinernema glaseri TaxID=37863 RepID=A0A1I7ZYV9_9BILA
MDAVPFTFVDSVIQLFSKDTLEELARKVRNPLWKAVVDLHHRNRVYCSVHLKKTKHGIKYVFLDKNYDVYTKMVQKSRRFLRIQGITDDTDGSNWMFNIRWEEVQPLGEPEI